MPATDTEQVLTAEQLSPKESGAPTPPRVFVKDALIPRLPRELVLEIIQLAANDTFYNLPVVVSHVCSDWRELVLGSPRLWTTISIRTIKRDNIRRQIERASIFAARSSHHPLTVLVDLAPPGVPLAGAQDLVSCIAAFSSRHFDRIYNLRIRYTPEFQEVGVSAMVPPALARQLTACSIQCVPSDFFVFSEEFPKHEEPINQVVIPSFQLPDGGSSSDGQLEENFPNLEGLALIATALVWDRFAPRNLQYLTLHDLTSSTAPTWTALCAVLEANVPTLVDLDLDGVYPLGLPSPQAFLMPALQNLRLAYTELHFLAIITTMCYTPVLVELRLCDHVGYHVKAEADLQAWTFRRMTQYTPLQHVRYLHLSGIRFPDDSIPVAFLRRFCSLARLKLTKPDRRTLAALNCFLPHLCEQGKQDATGLATIQVVPLLSRLSLRKISLKLFSKFLEDRAAMNARGPTPFRRLDVLDVCFNWEEPEVDPAHFAVIQRDIVDRLDILEPLF